MFPIYTPVHGPEVQLSAVVHFSEAEESGRLARGLGLVPSRDHQLPLKRELSSNHVCYIHPPLPSERRATPRR